MNVAGLFQGFVVLLWIVVIGVIILVVARAWRGQPIRNSMIVVLVPLLLAVAVTSASAGLVFIQPEERGVVISAVSPTGYRFPALTPGLHWVIPFAENVITYPISRQTYTMSTSASEGQIQGDDSIAARTLDGQEIFVDASVIFTINPTRVIDVHIAWQNRYGPDLVRAQARGIVRDIVSQYRVDEVVSTKRFDMAQQVHDKMSEKLDENGLTLVDFVLRNITFSPEYAASVEQKQIAEQQAQQAKFVVEQRKQEAEQARQVAQGKADAAVIAAKGEAQARIVQADAEKQALDLISQALQDKPELLTYQYISKLAPNVQAMFLPSGSPFIFPLPTAAPLEATATPFPIPVPTTVPTVAP
ncbi:MAG: SPFH domain-containing protein [Chloroflexi bacterium]|nr:SPFH domain-containing protein [Chloroflexota bacterium]